MYLFCASTNILKQYFSAFSTNLFTKTQFIISCHSKSTVRAPREVCWEWSGLYFFTKHASTPQHYSYTQSIAVLQYNVFGTGIRGVRMRSKKTPFTHISIFCILFWCCYIHIKEQSFRHTQYIYIINNVELNSGQHVSITQDHLQALVHIFLILKQSLKQRCMSLAIV
jgi:hypothetical protein